jgi:hypothetical protein
MALLAACDDEANAQPETTPAPITSQTFLAQPGVASSSPPTMLQPCLAPTHPTVPSKPAVFGETAMTLMNYLNAGATLSEATTLLQSWGYLYTDRSTGQLAGGVRPVRVLPGAATQAVWTFFDPTQIDPQHPPLRMGELIVLACIGGQYRLAYQATADPIFLGAVLNPRLFSDEDVTGDGVGDLSFLTGDCGTGNCVDAMTVLSVVGAATPNRLNNILPDVDAITKPHPLFAFVPAPNSPSKNLLVRPGEAAGAGSGPLRAVTETWSFTGYVFTRTGKLFGPPVYRIHALHDADEALRQRDFVTAEMLYWRVINDATLQNWRAGAAAQTEAQMLAAFAYVRLMQSAAIRGDAATAQTALNNLQTMALKSSVGEPYIRLGEAFYEAYTQTNDYRRACAAAIAYAESNPATYRMLGADVYGFDNFDYAASDMCVQLQQ